MSPGIIASFLRCASRQSLCTLSTRDLSLIVEEPVLSDIYLDALGSSADIDAMHASFQGRNNLQRCQ